MHKKEKLIKKNFHVFIRIFLLEKKYTGGSSVLDSMEKRCNTSSAVEIDSLKINAINHHFR